MPVRWRLALASAGLTLAILIVFSVAVGRLTEDRLRSDFRKEVRTAASELAVQVHVSSSPGLGPVVRSPRLDEYSMPEKAVIRIVTQRGEVLSETENAPDLGRPQPGLSSVGELRVATVPVLTNAFGVTAAYVQYGLDSGSLDATVGRLWLFLALGVLGATALAMLAGLAVADRAMRPISELTATARRIAETRDPSLRIPEPEASDEVAELARTLDEMLRSLDAARAETQQAMQRQREFVADASHELRTPLTSILANLELLQESLQRAGLDEDGEMVDSALRSSKRMSRLVADLLVLARADAGRGGARGPCDLSRVVSGAVDEVEPVAGGRMIVLDNNRAVPVSGNPDELHRAATNLLENALRHTPPGTTVRVATRVEAGEAVLEVADDGPGIPAEIREHVFSRFVRGDGTADTVAGEGTGLGLAIVRAVAEAHGGEVTAGVSEPGGALFTVRLPSIEDASPQPSHLQKF